MEIPTLILEVPEILMLDDENKMTFDIQAYILGRKRNAAYKTYIVYGGLQQSLENDLSQLKRCFLDYEFLGLC